MSTPKKLKKELKLFDVYAICTGAMFSSGFFLLPGLAAAQTGPSVALAYLIAGILMLPAMFSMAELSTAMPRAGGDYYFLDRALGPIFGTVGGIGTYLALSLKSAFALVGMGAYIAIFFDVPIQPLAVVLTIAFAILNIAGAKETTSLQRILIIVLVGVMSLFIIQGLVTVFTDPPLPIAEQFTDFTPFGVSGLLGTVGFVFVSYAGLTKIASVSEEVVNPGRNIPLGMMLSIISTTMIYVVGIFIMTAVTTPEAFREDLTPVATTAEQLFTWMPGALGVILVVASAVAAFASTGNAGILAASRYPLAMSRDRLLPKTFSKIGFRGRFQTPVFSIVFTSALMIVAIVVLDEGTIAKVASTFQLLIFMLVNFSVIVMRESRIEFYDPIYRSPLYPWMQIAGILASLFLLSYLGTDALLATLMVCILAVAWYAYYARKNVVRHGAIYHWFANLGQRRYEGIEHELREILQEKGLRADDDFDKVVTRAAVLDLDEFKSFDQISDDVVNIFTQRYPMLDPSAAQDFVGTMHRNYALTQRGAAIPNLRLPQVDHTELVIVRSKQSISIDPDPNDDIPEAHPIHAFFFLISGENQTGQHLRVMAEIAKHVDTDDFNHTWQHAIGEQELKEILLHDERVLVLWVDPKTHTQFFIGKAIKDLRLPHDTLVALVARNGDVIIPRGDTILQAGDRLTIIGSPDEIQGLYKKYLGDDLTDDAPKPA